MVTAFSSCNVTKYLGPEDYLVKENKIEIVDRLDAETKAILIENLSSLVIQKPNTKHLEIPREYLYFKNKKAIDAGNAKGLAKEAQAPVLYRDKLMHLTAERMQKFLRNSKGFYHAKVYPKVTLRKNKTSLFFKHQKAEVVYYVYCDHRYTIRSKEYFAEDTTVLEIIQEHESKSLIKPGVAIDEYTFDQEKSRIYNIMQNFGYARFAKNDIEFKADSSKQQMDIFARILAPADGKTHKKYSIGNINVYTNYKGNTDTTGLFIERKNNISYIYDNEKFYVNPSALRRAIALQPKQQYKKSQVDITYSALSKLGIFRFLNIKPRISTEQDTVIHYDIFLTPNTKIWDLEGSFNLFYTYLSNNNDPLNLLGTSVTSSLSNINMFGGGEKFSVFGEASGEFGLIKNRTNFSSKVGTQLSFPTLIEYRDWSRKLLTKFITIDRYFEIKNNTTTNISVTYNYLSQFKQLKQHNVNLRFILEYKPNQNISYSLSPFTINSLTSNIDPDFKKNVLDKSPYLTRSYSDRLITNFLIPQFTVQYNSSNKKSFNYRYRFSTEVSGLEVLAFNKLSNLITGKSTLWGIKLNKEYGFSRYALADFEISGNYRLSKNNALAGRFHTGIGIPFLLGDVIPYVRQFYVGGANSLRAWDTRELGPGGYVDDSNFKFGFYQSGDLVLEANLEYRFPIYSVFKGALFMDAGNIWTLYEDLSRPASNFKVNSFYKQIAVGTGFGIRADLSLFVIALDFGYKLRYPYKIEAHKNKYWYVNPNIFEYISKPNFVINLNYPF